MKHIFKLTTKPPSGKRFADELAEKVCAKLKHTKGVASRAEERRPRSAKGV